jgi:hypothetical protein
MLDSAERFRGAVRARESQALTVARQMADRPAPGRSLSQSRAPRILSIALTGAAYVALGTVLWAAYGQLGRDVRPVRPPLVAADETPVKVIPSATGRQQSAVAPTTSAAALEPSPEEPASIFPELASDTPASAAPVPATRTELGIRRSRPRLGPTSGNAGAGTGARRSGGAARLGNA